MSRLTCLRQALPALASEVRHTPDRAWRIQSSLLPSLCPTAYAQWDACNISIAACKSPHKHRVQTAKGAGCPVSSMQLCRLPTALGKSYTHQRCRPVGRAASRVQHRRPCVRVRAADAPQGGSSNSSSSSSSSSSSVIAEPVQAYTPEELQDFVQQDRAAAEEDFGGALREAFVTDADALFEYPMR
jgi:hypothetical protein